MEELEPCAPLLEVWNPKAIIENSIKVLRETKSRTPHNQQFCVQVLIQKNLRADLKEVSSFSSSSQRYLQ